MLWGAAPFPPNPRPLSPAAGERGVLPWELSMSCSRKSALGSGPVARGAFAARGLGARWNDVSNRLHVRFSPSNGNRHQTTMTS